LFKTNLNIEVIGYQTFILLSHLVYENDDLVITIHPGFDFDGASIPQIFWSIIGSPMTGRYQRAACLHDALYASRLFDRSYCDNLFYQAMIREGVPKFKAKLIYYAVRAGGQKAYDEGSVIVYRELVQVDLK